MDNILNRHPLTLLLLFALLHVLFVLGAWQGVTAITGALLTIQSVTGGGELILPHDFALDVLELFVIPLGALVYIISVKHDKWLSLPIVYRHRLETLLVTLFFLTALLALSFGDKSLFGFTIAGAVGVLLGLYFRPAWAILLVLSLGICLTVLVWWLHGSFMAVTLGLWFQNILLISAGLGMMWGQILKKP